MKNIIQRPTRSSRTLWLLASALLMVLVAMGSGDVRQASAQAFGTVQVQVQLVDANNQQVTGDLSNFVFTVTSGGATFNLPPTNAQGVTQLGVAPGAYSISMQPRPGVVQAGFFIGGTQVGNFNVTSGQTVNVIARNQVAGTGTITIGKQIVDQLNNPVAAADRSGFQFTITGPNSLTQTVTTDINGAATLTNLGAGTYQINEQARAGFTFVSTAINGVPAQNPATFTLAAGNTAQVIATNRQGGSSGSVQVTKQIVDQNNVIVATADESNFQFTLTCGAATAQGTTDASGVVTFSGVPAGNCQLSEATRTGFTFVSIFVGTSTTDIGNNGTFQVTGGQQTSLIVRNRATAAATEPIQLFTGCNNVSLTWPNGTATSVPAGTITPAGTLIAMWRFENSQQRFLGYSPIPGAPNDLNTVNRFDAVFICVNGPATLTRPTA